MDPALAHANSQEDHTIVGTRDDGLLESGS
jgi:hypothetical protein